jgi:hypothetical protein
MNKYEKGEELSSNTLFIRWRSSCGLLDRAILYHAALNSSVDTPMEYEDYGETKTWERKLTVNNIKIDTNIKCYKTTFLLSV